MLQNLRNRDSEQSRKRTSDTVSMIEELMTRTTLVHVCLHPGEQKNFSGIYFKGKIFVNNFQRICNCI